VAELLGGRYAVTGRGQYRDEFVTCGGVPLKEVSFDAFESKVVQGLHLCGEVRLFLLFFPSPALLRLDTATAKAHSRQPSSFTTSTARCWTWTA